MSTTEAMERLDTAMHQGPALSEEDLADLRAHIWALANLVVEAMDDPPRQTAMDGKDWEERAAEIVS
jgi:hypothetical protein